MQRLSDDASIGLITFNDPSRANAMTEDMARAFREVVKEARTVEPTAIVVTGAGDAFSAGGDMEMIRRKQQQAAEENSIEMFAFYESFLGILDLNIPLIAAMNGAAIGAGLCFACACDMRIAADSDEKIFGFSFAKLGLTPGMGGTIFPHRFVRDNRAQDMLENGYNITPREASEIGMVEELVVPEELMPRTLEYAATIANSPYSIGQIMDKRVPWDERIIGLVEEAKRQGASFLSERHLELYPRVLEELRARRGR